MDDDEFQLFRRLMKALDITKFDGDEKCWYIPKADAMKVLGVGDNESDLEVDHADGTIPLAEFM